MVFNSITFFLTLGAFLAFYFTARTRSAKATKVGTLLYSWFFYGMWNPAFLVLILASTLVDYGAALGMRRFPARRRSLLLASLVTNLGLLGTFKYWNFFASTAAWVAAQLGSEWQPGTLDVLLPVGISFYTFQTLSYTIDVYRGELEPRRSLLDVALYVAFFPQLVAGPILRASEFLPQIEDGPRVTARRVADGIFFVCFGLFMKVVVADNCAPHVNRLFASWEENSIVENWLAATLFGVQIHGDFSGYSGVAIGLSLLMGYDIPRNFFAPYGARGFSDFWRRWHISLSSWLRDYLYIPLGGNRRGAGRTYVNLMATMLLGGLWHGASFLFVIWGALHGFYLCAERLLGARIGPRLERALPAAARAPLWILLTFATVSITWIPFRASSAEQGLTMMAGMFSGPLGSVRGHGWELAAVAVVLLSHCMWSRRDFIAWACSRPVARVACLTFFLLSLYLLSGERSEFIYFQF
jgi:alginate O-acetyltransferase complex protein AlgI